MAVYTIELGKLISTGFDIGLTSYPLPNFLQASGDREAWRNALNQKIINHYQFNEIGCLPPDRFKVFLNNAMNEQMPYYNKLYEALNEEWNFHTGGTITEVVTDAYTGDRTLNRSGDDSLTRSGTDTTGNITQNTNNSENYNLNVASDTPAALLNIETAIANNTYASNAVKNKGNDSSTGHSTSTDTTTYNSKETTSHNTKDTENDTHNNDRNRTVTGLSGQSYAKLFKEYSESIRNLDLEVINMLSDCFMGIF